MEAIKENWKTIKEAVRREYSLSDISYHTWVEPLEFHNVVNDVVSIIIPSDQAHALNYISSKYKSFFQVTITEMFDHPYDISFILEKDVKGEEPAENEMAAPNQIYGVNYEDAHLNPKYKFDTFVVGSNNKFAHSASLAVAESPGEVYNPLYLYGGPGLGKTHLMHSIGHFILEQDPDKKVLYVTSEEFTNEFIEALADTNQSSGQIKEFNRRYREVDVLLIDDIQGLQSKPGTLNALFRIFNSMIPKGKQFVFSADRAPKNIDLDERYVSRFNSGATIDIQPPDDETKRNIIKSLIRHYQSRENTSFVITDEILDYIVDNSSSNIRELKSAITNVIFAMKMNKDHTLSEGQVKELLGNHFIGGGKKRITIEMIQAAVEDFYGVSHKDIVGRGRARSIVRPRQVAIYLCRDLSETTLSNIGKAFNRDHTTVLHSCELISSQMQEDRNLREELEAVREKIRIQQY